MERVRTVTGRDIRRLRLANQLVGPPGTRGVAETVGHLLAVQAQDLAQALWAIGVRRAGSTRADVRAALERGELLRSWPMRGTLHWVAPADLRWMLRLTVPRQLAGQGARLRQLELDQHTLDQAMEVAVRTLAGGRRLGRADFLRSLEEAGIPTSGQRGPHLIGYLSQTEIIVQGPPDGAGQAIVLLDEWAPQDRTLERDEALREFVLRYFRGHGPATERDFAWWSKLTLADTRTGIALAREELLGLEYGDQTYWIAADRAEAQSRSPSPRVLLLPGFDEYLLGYRDRSHVLAADHAGRVVPGGNGVFLPVIISNGRVVGTWRRAVGKDSVTVTPVPFGSLTARETAAIARQTAAYARFLGLPEGDSGLLASNPVG